MVIGGAVDHGHVAGVSIYDLTVAVAGGAGLRITAPPTAPQPYQITIMGGSIGSRTHTAVEIDNGRLIDITLSNVGAPVILGRYAGADISIRGNGAEYGWTYRGASNGGNVATPLKLRTPYGLYGIPNSGQRVGVAALQATVSGIESARLTMDGRMPNAYNCFNPGYGQTFNMNIQLMAQDLTAPINWYGWTLPIGIFSAWSGPHTSVWSSGTPSSLSGGTGSGAGVTTAADKTNGCLSISFNPPSGNAHRWAVTALISFARAP